MSPSLSDAVAWRANVAGEIRPEPSLGLVIETAGSAFTMMVTLLVDLSPTMSVSTADNTYVPAERPVTSMRYGLLLSTPSELVLLKNSTWLTLLPPPDTEARTVNVAGAVNTVPLVGVVIVMTGAAGLGSAATNIKRVRSVGRRFGKHALILFHQCA